ncbi:secretin N-terminal domain-containing protein, partial [Gammaproteobacteria bacterium]|nr:secretin N-terminal domain-containing protein [Gammaproteobacteria bacterium]
ELRFADVGELLPVLAGTTISAPVASDGSANDGDTAPAALTGQNGARFAADLRTNTLIVTAPTSRLGAIADLVDQLDREVEQVSVEARIVELERSYSQSLGSRLTLHYGVDFPELAGIGNVGREGLLSGSAASRGAVSALPAASRSGGEPLALGGSLLQLEPGWSALLGVELSALEAQGVAHLIASPRLTTANRRQARIEQGIERLFLIENEDDGDQLLTKRAVLGIAVTPRILPGGRVLLDVAVTQDAFIGTDPAINTKTIDTQILLEDGATAIIGGIFQKSEAQAREGLPGSSGWPFFRHLLGRSIDEGEMREVIVTLTPRIVDHRAKPATTPGELPGPLAYARYQDGAYGLSTS